MRRRTSKASRKPKVIAGLLLLGIVVFGGGSIYAATRPTWTAPTTASAPMGHSRPDAGGAAATKASKATMVSRTHQAPAPAAAPNAAATASTAKGMPGTTQATTSSPSITYTVKSGDTLSGIAQWFKLHGYGGLYRANMAVIGADPNLIFPGQRITISHGKMTMGQAAQTTGAGR